MAENLGNGGRPRNAKTLENLVAIRLQNLPTPNYYLPFPCQSPPTGRGWEGGGGPTPTPAHARETPIFLWNCSSGNDRSRTPCQAVQFPPRGAGKAPAPQNRSFLQNVAPGKKQRKRRPPKAAETVVGFHGWLRLWATAAAQGMQKPFGIS